MREDQEDDEPVTEVQAELQVDEGFHVSSAQAASWVVRKVLEARAYRQRVEAWAAAELARSEREEAFFVQRFGGELEAWLRQELVRTGGRRRSVNLPAGVVGLRRTPAGLDVTDESRLVAWCHKCLPEAVVVRASVSKSAVAEYVKVTGELPDGTAIRDGGERFYIK